MHKYKNVAGRQDVRQNSGAERGPQTPHKPMMYCCTRKINLILECLRGAIISKAEQTFQANSVPAR